MDRAIIRTALAAHPQLRGNLRTLVQHLSGGAFEEPELGAIEHELVGALSVSEAMGLPSAMPGQGQPLTLDTEQLRILRKILGRFCDARLRARVEHELGAALDAGRLQIQ